MPATTERRGDWMQTYTGRRFWPLDPRSEDVDMNDIAHALSLIARFGGHTRRHYSVAEHSLLVEHLVEDPALKLHALLHDAHEAYLGDVIAPLKRHAALQGGLGYSAWSEPWEGVEADIQRAIHQRHGMRELTHAEEQVIRHADLRALATERRDLMMPTADRWPVLDGIEPATRRNLHPHQAPSGLRGLFIGRAGHLLREGLGAPR